MKNYQKLLMERYSDLDFKDNRVDFMVGLIVDTIEEYELGEELLDYLIQNPNATLEELYQHTRMYWLPVLVISDDDIDWDAIDKYEDRMIKKLSRFITDEKSRYRVWDELLFISMQQQFMEKMEKYVDEHPKASFEELKNHSSKLSREWREGFKESGRNNELDGEED